MLRAGVRLDKSLRLVLSIKRSVSEVLVSGDLTSITGAKIDATTESVAQSSADESILPHAGKSCHELPAVYPSEASLRDFIEAATIAMHSVSVDGTLLWANQAELDLLGYKHEEYIGRNIADFHADQPVIDEHAFTLEPWRNIAGIPGAAALQRWIYKTRCS